MQKFTVLAAVILAIGVSGCTRSNDALRVNTQAPPKPLPSTPSGNLQSAQLDPVQPQPTIVEPAQPQIPQAAPTAPETPTAVQNTQVASIDPEAASKPITHETMTGAWNVNSDNPECRVFLSFTQWSGGYRAGTRRCNDPALTSVSAWDVKGNQVVLVDSNGAQVASLGAVGSERYAGSLSGGKPVTFSR